ncbi:kinase-like domain-containing protein [Gamsiella multidivaricata]|uniref:kinase-like domain-containing protein n=1 Tax=Gamsiella multidivaricata TaxID=101098 RepID=UPI002220387B|nr:kinase-like domain-containing protein [Gamsiella multidivaricata]KAG0351416.1 hypothetical protein BGZ54_003258 [Gamsiella multidivaricata]KAI7828730.1 kinase-like domain-containing protein [Gamsiella multidivaricata]
MSPSLQPSPVSQLPQTIDNGRLVLQDMLGLGAYGSVYRAIDTQTGQSYAVKSLNKTGLDSRQRAFQNHEAKLHATVSGHPNIATLHKVIEEENCLHMVLDCGTEGDLFYTITERGEFIGNSSAIKLIFSQIASAVMHCHTKGVYHRDLKPENIIMFGPSVKLVDFGLATVEQTSNDFGCGSTFYLSPECQGGYIEAVKSYDSAANDVWSLGVILINLVFGRNPWKQACPRDETFAAYVANNDFLQTILPISVELNGIIKSVFCLNPKKRITLPELVRRVQACGSFTTPESYASSPSATTTVDAAAAATVVHTASHRRGDEKLYNNGDKEDSGVDLRSLA